MEQPDLTIPNYGTLTGTGKEWIPPTPSEFEPKIRPINQDPYVENILQKDFDHQNPSFEEFKTRLAWDPSWFHRVIPPSSRYVAITTYGPTKDYDIITKPGTKPKITIWRFSDDPRLLCEIMNYELRKKNPYGIVVPFHIRSTANFLEIPLNHGGSSASNGIDEEFNATIKSATDSAVRGAEKVENERARAYGIENQRVKLTKQFNDRLKQFRSHMRVSTDIDQQKFEAEIENWTQRKPEEDFLVAKSGDVEKFGYESKQVMKNLPTLMFSQATWHVKNTIMLDRENTDMTRIVWRKKMVEPGKYILLRVVQQKVKTY